MTRTSRISQLIDQGFDLSTAVPFESAWRVRCSQCEAAVINGIPCHETGCPNIVSGSEDEDEVCDGCRSYGPGSRCGCKGRWR